MIIGIDDSGDFTKDDWSLYASIFIRPKRYQKIKKKFEEWEEKLPESVKENGEVKGKLLSEAQLIDFADKILMNNGYGAIKVQVFGIQINESNTKALKNQQKLNVDQMRTQAKEVYRNKGKKYNQIASFYEQMADWLGSKSPKTLFKLELLGITIVKSLNLAIMTSTNRNFDKELGMLEINIDEGITGRKSVDRYFKDTMRTIFWNLTSQVEPLIMISEWRPNHPFLKKFIKYPESRHRIGSFKHSIRNVFQFHDSKQKYEIRIADIVASAYFRWYVKKEPLDDAIEAIASQLVLYRMPFIKVALSNRKNPDPVNPYTDRIDGVTATELEERYGKNEN